MNIGSYGALPLSVRAACDELTTKVESNPDHFHRLGYQSLLKESRELIAKLIGASTDECVLVPNTSHGINTVMRNFEWHEGDIIVRGASNNSLFRT